MYIDPGCSKPYPTVEEWDRVIAENLTAYPVEAEDTVEPLSNVRNEVVHEDNEQPY